MGKGRTTEGMIIACLIQNVSLPNKQHNNNMVTIWPNDIPKLSAEDAHDDQIFTLEKEDLKTQQKCSCITKWTIYDYFQFNKFIN